MKEFLFFGNPSDHGDLVDTLLWRISRRKLAESIGEAKLRECAAGHVAWMESELSRQSALSLGRDEGS